MVVGWVRVSLLGGVRRSAGRLKVWNKVVCQGRQARNVSELERWFAVVKIRLSIELDLIRTVCMPWS